MLAQFLVRYFDRRRGKVACILGAALITPALYSLRRRIERKEKSLNRDTMLLGRLELTGVLISAWWKK